MKISLWVIATLCTLVGAQAFGETQGSAYQGAARDAWVAGKVEMTFTLSPHLNPFAINTDVEAGVVRLSGTVDSDIDRDLAEELAKGIEGVVAVENALAVDAESAKTAEAEATPAQRDFPSWFDDATTTAAVKAKLIAHANTEGLQIDVDTHDDVVTLSGRVSSTEQRQLAEELAKNTGDVRSVRNQLIVDTGR